jgi:hypothetical protein
MTLGFEIRFARANPTGKSGSIFQFEFDGRVFVVPNIFARASVGRFGRNDETKKTL